MLLEPQSTENIIVGLKYENSFSWYVTKKDIWFMDTEKLKAAYAIKFKEYGLPLSNLTFGVADPERQDIPVLNEYTIGLFKSRLEKNLVTVDKLKERLQSCVATNDSEQVHFDFLPSLYLDFDKHCLYSMYTEPASFEDAVPNNWNGKYINFLGLIEQDQKFWYDNGEIIFDFSKGNMKNG